MFSGAPYGKAVITLVNEETGEVFKTRTLEEATAVEQLSWGQIKRELAGRPKRNSLDIGSYAIDLPNGVYTMAVTDQEVPSAKPTAQDLFALQFDSQRNLFVPRVFKLRVDGNTQYNEALLPKDFDLEYAWTVLSGRSMKVDYNNTTFWVEDTTVRKKYKSDPNGAKVDSKSSDILMNAIKEVVRLDTEGRIAPKIERGNSGPDFIANENGTGSRVPEGYILYFWDSELPQGFTGAGARWPWPNEKGHIESSLARFSPYADFKVITQEVLGSIGMFGEPSTNKDLKERIVGEGGSMFLDLDGNPGFITPRDAQIIRYHGTRPLGTRVPDISERIVNE
jgi:hypothetical protein